MIANTVTMIEFKKTDSFFDYWHFNDVDSPAKPSTEKTAEKIAEKIRMNQVCKELPEHYVQLLFLS